MRGRRRDRERERSGFVCKGRKKEVGWCARGRERDSLRGKGGEREEAARRRRPTPGTAPAPASRLRGRWPPSTDDADRARPAARAAPQRKKSPSPLAKSCARERAGAIPRRGARARWGAMRLFPWSGRGERWRLRRAGAAGETRGGEGERETRARAAPAHTLAKTHNHRKRNRALHPFPTHTDVARRRDLARARPPLARNTQTHRFRPASWGVCPRDTAVHQKKTRPLATEPEPHAGREVGRMKRRLDDPAQGGPKRVAAG